VSKPIFVVSADWHLERYAWAKYPDLAGDAYFGLEQLIQYCVEHELPLVAAGDLFEKNYPDSLSVNVAHRAMSLMESKSLPVYFIQGQHEMVREQPWLGIHKWPIHVHKKLFQIEDYLLYGLDYQRSDTIGSELKQIPKNSDILVAHQVWHDFMGNIGKPECSSSDVPHVRYIVTGDFHKLVLASGVGSTHQNLKIISPGPLCLQSTSEPVDKFFLIFHSDGEVTTQKLKTRPFYKHVISRGIDWDAWHVFLERDCKPGDEDLPENIRKPILYIKYPADMKNAYEKILRIVEDKYHLFLNPISEYQPSLVLADAEERKEQASVDVQGCLAKTIDALFGESSKKGKDVFECVSRLLERELHGSSKEELQIMERDMDR